MTGMPRHLTAILALLALALLLSGCASRGLSFTKKEATQVQAGEAFQVFNGEYAVDPALAANPPRSVAVLPFWGDPADWSFKMDEEWPPDILRRAFYNHLSSLAFRDQEMNVTDRRLARVGLTGAEQVNELLDTDPRRLKELLGVDAAVGCEVTHFDRVYAGIFSQVAVGCRVRLVDLETGRVLWQARHVSRGVGGGPAITPVGLALSAVGSLWNLREVQMLRETDDLFREMVSTLESGLPPELAAAAAPAPRLDLFARLGKDGPYRAGQAVSFRMVGDPGGVARAELVGLAADIELRPLPEELKQSVREQTLRLFRDRYLASGREVTPRLMQAVEQELASREIYEGEWVVPPGSEAYGVAARGTLAAPAGRSAAMLYAPRNVDVDSLPPAAPRDLVAAPLDSKLALAWASGTEPDLAGYKVLVSANATSGFAEAMATEDNQIVLAGLDNFVPVHVRVRAVDKAGNQSPDSLPARGVPLPDPGLYGLTAPGSMLMGEIAEPVLLRADRGPFSVLGRVTVVPGGVLHVEPGAELLFAPGSSLAVRGGDLFAYGRADAPVRLAPRAGESGPGGFEGLVLEGAGRMLLRHVTVDRARVGVSIRDAAPELYGVTVTGSSQAGVLLGQGAAPSLACCLVQGNQGMGGLVVEGGGLHPRIRGNGFLDNEPFQVQSFAPVELDLAGNWWGRPAPDQARFLGRMRVHPWLVSPPANCAR